MTAGGIKVRAPKQVPRWRVGTPVSAAHLNSMVEQGNAVARAVDPARQVRRRVQAATPRGAIGSARLRIHYDDYLLVDAWNPDTGDFDSSQSLYIAKPWDLQRTPWDGLAYGGVLYSYESSSRRHATGAGIDQVEIIIPRYLSGVIVKYRAVDWTGVNHPSSGEDIRFEDANAAGRTWTELEP